MIRKNSALYYVIWCPLEHNRHIDGQSKLYNRYAFGKKKCRHLSINEAEYFNHILQKSI